MEKLMYRPVEAAQALGMGRTAVFALIKSGRLRSIKLGGARFVTAQHWRLSQLFPEEMAHATQHFTDLVDKQVVLAMAEGLLAPEDPQRDAWFVTYTSPVADPTYIMEWILGLWLLGLSLERFQRRVPYV